MHIVFCTPYGATATPEHYRRKAMVQAGMALHTFSYVEIDMHIVSKARSIIVQATPPGADVLWFVDSDVLLPPNAPELLTGLEHSPVVSGVYFSRRHPYLPQVYNRVSAEIDNFSYLPVVSLPQEPFFADAVGAGCLLVRRSVFEDLTKEHKEWRDTVHKWTKRWLKRRKENSETMAVLRALLLGSALTPHFEFLDTVGEDFWFCDQLRFFLGIRPWVMPQVMCEHEAIRPVTVADYHAALNAGQIQYVSESREERGAA